jgi:hypothetical protein
MYYLSTQDGNSRTYILLANKNLHRPPLRHHLRNIAQPHFGLTVLVWLHAQVFQQLRVEPPSRAQLGQIVFQALDSRRDICFESREIGWVVGGRGVFLRSGLGFGFIAGGFAAFFEEGACGGEGAAIRESALLMGG